MIFLIFALVVRQNSVRMYEAQLPALMEFSGEAATSHEFGSNLAGPDLEGRPEARTLRRHQVINLVAAPFTRRVHNDDEDRLHESKRRPCLGPCSAFASPGYVSQVHNECDPGGSTRRMKQAGA